MENLDNSNCTLLGLVRPKDRKAKTVQSEKEGDIAGPNASSWAPFLILRHFAVHLGQEYFTRDIYIYSTRIQNRFLSPIYMLDFNTELESIQHSMYLSDHGQVTR